MKMKWKRASLAALLAVILPIQQVHAAQGRQSFLITRGELRAAMRSAAEQREANLQRVRRLLRQPEVEREAGRLVDLVRVSRALTALDDRTLERLAVESDRAGESLRAEGAGKVLIIVGLVVVILLVIVSATLPESS